MSARGASSNRSTCMRWSHMFTHLSFRCFWVEVWSILPPTNRVRVCETPEGHHQRGEERKDFQPQASSAMVVWAEARGEKETPEQVDRCQEKLQLPALCIHVVGSQSAFILCRVEQGNTTAASRRRTNRQILLADRDFSERRMGRV